ncbi:HEL273Cp [Eremothecium sinecaudum]|uniref:HEL273Cp n=1 Tax=Eremothecium sinecaudum TaxID=45286 RepID=A0A0X8HT97_9SACH|nr:HEL273Cp [Eremothecium sinecaudum]AMD21008.1 HEL273Cp [Eremothecium sinecaudum]
MFRKGYIPLLNVETFSLGDGKYGLNSSRRRPIWTRLLFYILCVAIPLLIIMFGAREFRIQSEKSQPRSWRLDTQRNYTMNRGYWKKENKSQDRHYYFNITKLVEGGPDGVIRNLTVVNGQYPGPLIEANAGDTLWIHVNNLMKDEPVTIHCHGLFFNNEDNFNDGAAGINQCPIPAGDHYTYKIKIDEKQWGTYWYHSHFSTQYADGLFGPLVIHSREEDEVLEDYDEDMVVMVNDYYHNVASTYLENYMSPENENTEPTPNNALIQGIGTYNHDSPMYMAPHVEQRDEGERQEASPSMPVINLKPGRKSRLRLINAGFFAPFEFSVDQHTLNIIEADGTNTVPKEVESVALSVGQRYSFILDRKDTELDSFWIRARFNEFCFKEDDISFDTEVRAIVSYSENKKYRAVESKGWEYKGPDPKCRDSHQSLFKTLNGKVPLGKENNRRPDTLVKLNIAFLTKERQLTRGYFNDVTYYPLKTSCSLYDLAFMPNNNTLRLLDSEDKLETKNENQYLINLDERGAVVDLVLNNYDDGAHPFHMHGYKFWVLKEGEKGYFNEDSYALDASDMDFDNPIYRDTINVNGFGYAVIRFVANNPGVWPFHCHIGWHMEAGLLLQMNILQSEYSKWQHFPFAWNNHCQATIKSNH